MKKVTISFLLVILAIIVVGCGAKNEEPVKNDEASNEAEASTVVVEHDLGTTEVTKKPEKIVVFDFGALDTLDKLGVDVVGVPQSGVIPSYLEKYASSDYENVGSLKEPDFEKIAEIDPDLIIISGRQGELYDQLQELGDTIYLAVDTTDYMASFEENVKTLGEIFNKEDEVQAALDDVKASIAGIEVMAKETNKNYIIILANEDKIR